MKNIIQLFFVLLTSTIYAQTNYYIESPDGTKLHIQEFGSGKPVILLAGGPGLNAGYLEPVWKKLSTSYKCVILDQRGTGKSIVHSVDSISMSMENYINDLESLRKHLKLEKLTLIGHSWGSMLSMEYTSQHPEKVNNLIFLSPGGISNKYLRYFSDNLLCRLPEEDKKEMKELVSQNKSIENFFWPAYFFDRGRALEILNLKIVDVDSIRGQDGVQKAVFQAYFQNQKTRMINLKNYSGDAILIAGRQDPLGESTFYEIKEHLPQIRIHFLERCGHFPWLENNKKAEEFFTLIFEHLNNDND